MKKIYYAGLNYNVCDETYEMIDSTECEYGDEWNGDVQGYIENLDIEEAYTLEDESALGNIHQPSTWNPIPGSIYVMMINGEPSEIYWATEEEDETMDRDNPFTYESFGEGPLPANWEEICDYLNDKAAEADEETTANDIWEAYWQGKYTDAPKAVVKEDVEKIKIQFESGTGKHFPGGVNLLIAGPDADVTIYAECPVPDKCSDDYGYLTMKNAIIKAFKKAGGDPEQLSFWYDGQEKYLDPDAAADCEVYVDVDLG